MSTSTLATICVAGAAVTVMMASCSLFSDHPPLPANIDQLEDVDWRLQSDARLDGSHAIVPDADEKYELRFSDGELRGVADCNDCYGSYTLTDNQMTAGLGCTEKACGPTGSSYPDFAQDVAEVDSFAFTRRTLRLYHTDSNGNVRVQRFSR